ncbi:MAG TPA: polysaccharide deacetylase family protein [Aggregatilinea sp.]|uniref:carbohydrate deacetylase n=1 Tax=Aggregatilinea sp. TaxID=2806333 RepID=UPI002B64A2CD|nr:polysaccharide deacetylase family protein [Aggregatilinea sp.]HML23800.1 polysaccharide deacetylase family protein [Aggregatilinea sp.]
MSQARQASTNELLGYPGDARLLLVNADDFGMYQSINEAVVQSFKAGIVCSTSLMAPLPGTAHAIQLAQENPEVRLGVHLSVIRDIGHYYWEPLAPREQIPSLLDEDGYFYTIERMLVMLERTRLDEAEIEFRAQIETVLAAGLKPTHVDWHCLHSGGRSDIFDLTMGLAKEYGLALRVASHPFIEQVQSQGLPTDDYDLLDSFSVDIDTKSAHYAHLLRDLPEGLSEWAVHPSFGSAESQEIDPGGWRVRRTDFDFVGSPEARAIIDREGIVLVSYEQLQTAWQNRA